MESVVPYLEELNGEWHLKNDALDQLAVYAGLLAEKNKVMNLTAVDDPRGIAVRHFADSLQPAALASFPENGSVIDVGTGAGFPGMVLAIARPDLRVTLLDSQKKRIGFLEEVIAALGLSNVRTVWGRAEDFGKDPLHREKYDAAVARAVAAMPVLSEYLAPFVRTGGCLTVWKGDAVLQEWEASEKALKILGMGPMADHPYTLPGENMKLHILISEKKHPTPKTYPRKAGLPSKQPLGADISHKE